ncbi:MAG: gamma-glutamyltransferase [Pseudomonadota bacterium]
MLNTPSAYRGVVTAPHHLAAQSGLLVLREGGNAIEAMLAAAATIAVVYPHMNSIGGDGFWLVGVPGAPPVAIDACGGAADAATPSLYRGMSAIPPRGPLAANTVAGTVSGWGEAERLSHDLGGHLPLERLLEDAIHYAERGVPVTAGQHRLTVAKHAEMGQSPGFGELFMPGGAAPPPGAAHTNSALAETLREIARFGPDSFYRGPLAERIAADLARVGAPVSADDLARHQAARCVPLEVTTGVGRLYNTRPPTQGVSSLQILALFDRLKHGGAPVEPESFGFVHALVEATKQAFITRNREVTDPAYMRREPEALLTDEELAAMAARIDLQRARPWPHAGQPGDTIWMGAVDRDGIAVSFIQSIYWEFGSGVVLEETGIQWQNRGSSFALDAGAPNALAPGRKPFHTLNPAMARLHDGRTITYGTMGGEGQPQTQAAIFSRYAMSGQDLQAAITAPRWLLGRTWGDESTNLKVESRLEPDTVEALRNAGHDIEVVGPFSDMMGHAGAVVQHANGLIEGATDPRSDGVVAAF